MTYLIYILFSFIFFLDFLMQIIGRNAGPMAILPECVSLLIGFFVLIFFALNKKINIPYRYLFFYLSFTLHISIGVIINQVQPLAVLMGIRNYLKFLPIYFLPFVCEQKSEDLIKILKFLLIIALVQFPISIYQRFFVDLTSSGDHVGGTLIRAPILTVFLLCVVSTLIGFYIKKRITGKTLSILLLITFLPTALNETKSTVIFLPIAIFLPALFGVQKGRRIKIMATILPIFLILIVGFSFIYAKIYSGRAGIYEFFSSDKVYSYLYKATDEQQELEGTESEIGRVDSIVLGYKKISKNLFTLFWGVGIGNAGVSFSKSFQGEYTTNYLLYAGKLTGISHFLWEIGLFGIIHILWFLLLILNDALSLRQETNLAGAIALSWIGVTAIIVLVLPYQNILTKDALVYPFLFFAGYLTSQRFNEK